MKGKTLTSSQDKDPKHKRAVIYLRVSTDKQVNKAIDPEGYSLPAQRDACYRKADSLGAQVIDEYVDYGETAKVSDRPEFQRMFERIKTQEDVDFLIIHKVNRFARNRRDDANFLYELKLHNVQLVSVSENIDGGPSGLLLHGIMAALAEYESANLATEAIKGMTKKAQVGGTPNRAPIGYENAEVLVDGRRIRGVIIDEERADLVKWAFETYATGQWTIDSLTDVLADRGLTTRATRKIASKPMSPSRVHHMLSNPYYVGIVCFQDVQYPGMHPPLISPELFQRVQDILSTHACGEKQRVHPHYLKSTVWCGECKSRLCLVQAKQRYLYFFCVGRQQKRTTCTHRYWPEQEVAGAVERFYQRIQLTPQRITKLRGSLRSELEVLSKQQMQDAKRATKRLLQLEQERNKLLQAHYADAIPIDLLKSEQQRIGSEVQRAERVVQEAQTHWSQVEEDIDLAIQLASDCQAMYLAAPPMVRRQFNQVFFEKLYVIGGEVVSAELREPFAALLAGDAVEWLLRNEDNSEPFYARSCKQSSLAPPTGFEPVLPP